jgi:hypothetical protein
MGDASVTAWEPPADNDTGTGDGEWVFVVDPLWTEGSPPPMEAVVGGWYVDAGGMTRRFHPNPEYVPIAPGSPTDPVDATMRLVRQGEVTAEEFLSTLGEVSLGMALDSDGEPFLAESPDGEPCLLVTTAPAHRTGLDVSGWLELSIGELAEVLPDEGIDVLLNPGAPVSMRLLASTVKEA